MVLLVLVTLLATVVFLIYLLAQRKFDYWQKKNVPHLKPLPFLGNYGKYILQQEYPGHVLQKLCQQFPNKPYFGAFYGTEPALVVQSPEILKRIFTKDFYYFHGREITNYEHKETITKNVFFSSGDEWKVVRQNMSPIFTSSRMKAMFHLIENCAYTFEDVLDRDTSASDVIDAKKLSARFTMDCICSCAFGIDAKTLVEPENNPLCFMADEIFKSSNYSGFKMVVRAIWPSIFYGLKFTYFPETIVDFFGQLLKGVVKSRNNKPSSRNDFVDMVLGIREKEGKIVCDSIHNIKSGRDDKVEVILDDEAIIAQCVAFFGAGFETSATMMSFTLYEFAKHPEVQERAAAEVDEFLLRYNNKLTYECTNELSYLEACLYETIRKYPVLGNLTREVMDDYVFPDGLKVEKGLRVHIPVYALHHNPDYFPEPQAYKPERFLAENKHDVKPFTFLPYGEGPRLCIGKRFSKMQIKAGLVTFLKKYRVELAEGMPSEVPLECRSFLMQPREMGLMLKVSKRKGWEQRTFVRT